LTDAEAAVRPGFELDAGALKRWMAGHLDLPGDPLRVSQFSGGQSNPTYRIEAGDRAFVLRRKPPGPLLKGAHDVLREARVMTALGGAGFPVPRILGVCEDPDVAGTAFYLMEHVDGRIVWDPAADLHTPSDRMAVFDAMNETLARLHSLDIDRIGLADYGKRGGFVTRQTALWTRQYQGDAEAGRDENMDRLVDWLATRDGLSDETSVIHGDFRIDNLMFDPVAPKVCAVVDWELSTLGDPASDFTYHLLMYRMPSEIFAGLAGVDLGALGIPSEADYVAAYCRRTGRTHIPNLDYLIVFNLFRLAAIVHGIKGRLVRGNASSAHAAQMVERLEPLAELAWAQADSARL